MQNYDCKNKCISCNFYYSSNMFATKLTQIFIDKKSFSAFTAFLFYRSK